MRENRTSESGPLPGLVLLGLLLSSGAAFGLINPNFTPVELVRQSGRIVRVEFRSKTVQGRTTATVVAVLKGAKDDRKPLTLDLTTSPFKEKAQAVAKLLASPNPRPVLLFVGKFKEQDPATGMMDMMDAGDFPEQEEDATPRQALLHVETQWIRFQEAGKGVWEMVDIDTHMLATWHGSPDMLEKCVRYILDDPDALVPVRSEASWAEHVKAGTVKGDVCSLMRVRLTDAAGPALFVGAAGGDRLFMWDKQKKQIVDRTGSVKLKAASAAATWGDFNGDGRLDLLSWDGKALAIHRQDANGVFHGKALQATGQSLDTCLGLAIVDSGKGGVPAVVFSRQGPPLVLTSTKGGMAATALTADKMPDDYATAGACLVADFDGDARPDILQPYVRGGLFFKGRGDGAFAAAAPVPVALRDASAKSAIGDFDADGRPDILMAATSFPMIWHNYPGMRWQEMFAETGEPSYIAKGGAVACDVGEINDDGRRDFLVLYANEGARTPHIFFNRGFRSFGHAHMLDLEEKDLLPESRKGQQAGILEDIDGDGAQDMVLVLADGSVWVFFREVFNPLSLEVALPLKGANTGPVKVWAHAAGRHRGAWNVVAGTAEAFFGQIDAGPMSVHWIVPGGREQTKQFLLEDKPLRYVIGQ